MKNKVKSSKNKATPNKTPRKVNWKVIFYSVIALVCLYLMYKVDWIFIVPALFFVWLNHKELFLKKK